MRIKIFNDTNKLDGIFNFTFKKYSDNYVYQNIVTAFASSTLSGRGDPTIVLNPYADKDEHVENWISKSEVNSNFTISFLHHLFSIDSYTVQSRSAYNSNFPLEWVLEATNDMKNWKQIHYKPHGTELVGLSQALHVKCPQKEFFQYYRFTMIGENRHSKTEEKYMFALGQIEFFGSLFEIKCTLPHYQFLHLFRFIYLPTFLFT